MTVRSKPSTTLFLPTALGFFLLATRTGAMVPLENWRSDYFRMAAEFEWADRTECGMFWDGIGFCDSVRIPKTLRAGTSMEGNYWRLEPAVSAGWRQLHDNGDTYADGHLYNEASYGALTARQLLHVDTRYDDDPDYPAHPGRALRGRIEEATLTAAWKYGFLRIGRQNRSWGPFPDRSLLLSSYPYTYDAVELQILGKGFEFRHLFAPFSNNRASGDSDDGSLYDRYLTAHSLNVRFNRWVTVGITETVLFTRRNAFPDLAYVNPVSIYSVINTNQEGDGNLMLGFQWNIHPGIEDVSLRGQLVLDDFQVDNNVVTDKEPTHWGIDAGIFWRNPFNSISYSHLLKLECIYASEWIYTVADENGRMGERYILNHKSLGLPFNDGLLLRGGMTAFLPYGIAGECMVSYRRAGGNTPLTSWRDDAFVRGLPVSYNRPVSRRAAAQLTILWPYREWIDMRTSVDIGWIRNRNNVATDRYVSDPAFSISAGVHLDNLHRKLPEP